ncbi:5-formyltetrahydrofolate cyclo-ligase [Bacillus chungangensis]|uniref:5-formyltetrahydrofolate cyclo-ligase n=1 Tax=Bacillus chungangensis TaxID=587633 RepID=A0ABT9WPH5_9BACI|nr:5-formyltetrahydrofolate cyclo-ligase [Bacillus chungangensis]MDQ0175191.1 5-formyltetrahydrofolate cyclo-ligase [Bacillus chungangensis]
MKKIDLRNEMKEKLAALEQPEYEQYSYMIANQLFKQSMWMDAETIGITISRKPEVDTWQIIRKGWELGKRIVVPKCEPSTKEMTFRVLTAFTQLEKIYYHLFEPIEKETEAVAQKEIDLLLVPGLLFCQNGFRIGFGGGYYDRYLTTFTGKTASLAFSFQVVEKLPVEDHDIPVQTIMTEKSILYPTSN